MKKFFNLAVIIAALLVFSQCKKDDTEMQTVNKTDPKTLDESIPIIDNPYPFELYLKNKQDIKDEDLNCQLYNLCNKFRPLFKDNKYNQIIITEALKNTNKCVSLDFILKFLSNKKSSNKLLLDNLSKEVEKSNLIHLSLNPYNKGEVEEYIPSIFVVNAESADYSKTPLISVSINVNDELSGMNEYEDYIVAFYYDESGNINDILLSEETAMSTTHPIFIFDNAQFNNKMEVVTFNPKVTSTSKSTVHVIDQYMINYRYDSSSNSEYSYELAYVYSGGYTLGGYRVEIDEINKNDIGKMFYNNLEIWQLNYFSSLSGFSMATFEYDWYASKKPVWTPVHNIWLGCRMKYSNEYYQRLYIPINQSNTEDNSKGYIKIFKQ